MLYTEREIIRSYRQANNKLEQIHILSELNATTPTIIADILTLNGENAAKFKRKCCTCNNLFIGTKRQKKCDSCKERAEFEKERMKRKKQFDKLVCKWLKENG